jgi:trehalose 2-sulfotransferase
MNILGSQSSNDFPQIIWALCTIARSGSSWLCDLIRSTNCLGYPEEYLLNVPRSFTGRGLSARLSVEEYLAATLRNHSSSNGVFGIKGSHEELIPFFELFAEAPCVWLRRENRVAQAISWYRAHDGGQWTRSSLSRPTQQTLEFSYPRIRWFYEEIARRESLWETFFAHRRTPPLVFYYEAICERPLEVVRAIADYIGIAPSNIRSVNSPLQIVRDRTTELWELEFRRQHAAPLQEIESSGACQVMKGALTNQLLAQEQSNSRARLR